MGKAWMLSPHDSEEGLATLAQCSHSVLYWRPESESHPAAAKSLQSCPNLCNPTDYAVQGILQIRILEWLAFTFSRGSSQPRDWTQVACIAGGFFTSWAIREALAREIRPKKKKKKRHTDWKEKNKTTPIHKDTNALLENLLQKLQKTRTNKRIWQDLSLKSIHKTNSISMY